MRRRWEDSRSRQRTLLTSHGDRGDAASSRDGAARAETEASAGAARQDLRDLQAGAL